MLEEDKPKTRALKEGKAPFGAQQGKYLYCVIKKNEAKSLNILGQEEEGVYTINEGDLAIVASDTSKREYSFIKEHLTTHQRVIEEVMRQGWDVLPARFGTVAPSVEYVKEKLLKANKGTFGNVSNSRGQDRIRLKGFVERHAKRLSGNS